MLRTIQNNTHNIDEPLVPIRRYESNLKRFTNECLLKNLIFKPGFEKRVPMVYLDKNQTRIAVGEKLKQKSSFYFMNDDEQNDCIQTP